SALTGVAAAIPGGLIVLLTDGRGALVLASLAFAVAAALSVQIPATRVAEERTDTLERQELRGSGILLAATAMGLLRGIVGFLTFLLAFELRSDDGEAWKFGMVVVAATVGGVLGAVLAPALRRSAMTEEKILQAVLGLTAISGVVSVFAGTMVGAPLLAGTVGLAASCGKLAFDAIVQRDAPDANRGRSFARFETRFQMIWVVGAFIPVILSIPAWIGFLAVAGCAGFAVLSYIAGQRAVARGDPIPDRTAEMRALIRKLRNGDEAKPPGSVREVDAG
ncbi:MAG TPA: hypothetical protein VGJ86_10360, partial [Acidimicrobiales bacterium]